MILQIIIGFIFCGVIFAAPTTEIHHDMTPEERFQVFNTAGTDVPTYDIVQIRSSKLQKRSVDRKIHIIQFKYNRNNITALLTSHTGVLATAKTPVYYATIVNGKSHLVEKPDVMKNIVDWLYENKAEGITMTIRKSRKGRVMMNGIIRNKNLHVRPIPDRLIGSMHRYKRSIDDDNGDFNNDYDHSYHIVYEIPELSHESSEKTELSRQVRQIYSKNFANTEMYSKNPEVVYPELLIIVDYPLFKKLGGNDQEVISYLLAFWNGVDMYYRPLRQPRYLINIAGIILAKNPKSLSYITKYMNNNVNADVTVNESLRWMKQHTKTIPTGSYDAVITMVEREMYSRNKKTNNYFEVLGLAKLGAICSESNAAIVRDRGGYSSMFPAAHELGHLLGAGHDSDYPKCRNHANTVMLGDRYAKPAMPKWSECSLEAFGNLFSIRDLSCLYNKPSAGGEVLPRLLPGKFVTPDQQCKDLYSDTIAVVDENFCSNMNCTYVGASYGPTESTAPAADGTICKPNKVCFQGVCTDEALVMA